MHDNNKGDAAFTIPIFYRSTGQYSVMNSPEMDKEIDSAMAATGADREQGFQKIFDKARKEYVTDIPMYHMIGYTRVGKRLEWKPDISTNSEIPLANIRFKK
jgi:peptide/nickel transport system substrate-binding protein